MRRKLTQIEKEVQRAPEPPQSDFAGIIEALIKAEEEQRKNPPPKKTFWEEFVDALAYQISSIRIGPPSCCCPHCGCNHCGCHR